MHRAIGIALAKGVELLLLLVLYREYGKAHSVSELLGIFQEQPELSQIGTIAALVIVSGIFLTTAHWLVSCVMAMINKARLPLANLQDGTAEAE